MGKPAFRDIADYELVSVDGFAEWVQKWRSKRWVDYSIKTHYHPYTDTLIERLNLDGLPALLDASYHATLTKPLAPAVYVPGPYASLPFPQHEIDVADDGPYS